MHRILKTIALAFTAIAIMSVTTPASADEGAFKYRSAVMKAVGGHMGAIAGILKGEVPHKEDLVGHTHAMAELAKSTGKIFPKGSDVEKSRALPEVWSKPGEFKMVVDTFVTESQKLADIAKSGDMGAFGAQFGKMAKASCKACHDNFRKKKG